MCEKTRRLSFRLLKPDIAAPEKALKKEHCLHLIKLAEDTQERVLYAGQAFNSPPKWLSFFENSERSEMSSLWGAGAAALLFVKTPIETDSTESRWLVVCFGQGFHALRAEAQESTFGMRVALNALGRKLIKSLDTRTPENSTIQRRTQNSRKGEIFEFGVDAERVILQSITGKTVDSDFGSLITGADGLTLNTKADYQGIIRKCQQIMRYYAQESYKENFPWYGNITPIKDTSIISELDGKLINSIHSNIELIHLAPPEIIDMQEVERYKYTNSTNDDDGFEELIFQNFLGSVPNVEVISVENLKESKIKIRSGENPNFQNKWSVYNCLVFEAEHNNSLYVLSNGNWYQVALSYVQRTNEYINAIKNCELAFPAYHDNGEGEYNKRICEQDPSNLICFDKNLIVFDGERGRVEFCDILAKDGKIIHVKKRDSSSNLSHLFMQGYVSAEAFLDYKDMRQQIRSKVPSSAEIVPEETPNSRDYEIVYALIHDRNPSLPFFSKVSLTATHKLLKRMGYEVSLSWIPRAMEDD
jgi:uncharacterized protein (TIGR04141 family)